MSKPGASTVILIGSGLSCGMVAWYLRRHRPELNVLLLEGKPRLDFQKTWSFHQSDVGAEFDEIAPLISREWKGYTVQFATYQRSFGDRYCSIKPAELFENLREVGVEVRFSTTIRRCDQTSVELEDGTQLEAECVLDGRGTSGIDRQCGSVLAANSAEFENVS